MGATVDKFELRIGNMKAKLDQIRASKIFDGGKTGREKAVREEEQKLHFRFLAIRHCPITYIPLYLNLQQEQKTVNVFIKNVMAGILLEPMKLSFKI